MRNRTRRPFIGALVLGAALSLTACGDDDGDGPAAEIDQKIEEGGDKLQEGVEKGKEAAEEAGDKVEEETDN